MVEYARVIGGFKGDGVNGEDGKGGGGIFECGDDGRNSRNAKDMGAFGSGGENSGNIKNGFGEENTVFKKLLGHGEDCDSGERFVGGGIDCGFGGGNSDESLKCSSEDFNRDIREEVGGGIIKKTTNNKYTTNKNYNNSTNNSNTTNYTNYHKSTYQPPNNNQLSNNHIYQTPNCHNNYDDLLFFFSYFYTKIRKDASKTGKVLRSYEGGLRTKGQSKRGQIIKS